MMKRILLLAVIAGATAGSLMARQSAQERIDAMEAAGVANDANPLYRENLSLLPEESRKARVPARHAAADADAGWFGATMSHLDQYKYRYLMGLLAAALAAQTARGAYGYGVGADEVSAEGYMPHQDWRGYIDPYSAGYYGRKRWNNRTAAPAASAVAPVSPSADTSDK